MTSTLYIIATLLAVQLCVADPQYGYPPHGYPPHGYPPHGYPHEFPPEDCDPHPPHYPHPIPEPPCDPPVVPPPHPQPHHPLPHPDVCDDSPLILPYPHGVPNWPHDGPLDCPYGWPKEWPLYFPNGWPNDWPCDFPIGGPHDFPHDFPHGLPHDWPHSFPHGWLHDAPHGIPNNWPCDWPDNWRDYWPADWPKYWPDLNDCDDYPYPGYPHGQFPGPHGPFPGPHGPHNVPSPHYPPHHPLPHPDVCDDGPYPHGLPNWPHDGPFDCPSNWPKEWPLYFPNGWPKDWPCDFPIGGPHDGHPDFPHGLPHDWPHSYPHGWLHDAPHGLPNNWPCDWPENWRDYWPADWPKYWPDLNDCDDYPYPGYPHGPFPGPHGPYPGPHGPHNVPSPHYPPHHPLPHPDVCDDGPYPHGLPNWPHDGPFDCPSNWPKEWPLYFPNGWPKDWPCDFPIGGPHDGHPDFPHGLPHDWPHSYPHGWLHDAPHGIPNNWPCDWPDNWRDFWPANWPKYWPDLNDCDDYPYPGYPHGPFPGPHGPHHPIPLPEPCDDSPPLIPFPHGQPNWPRECPYGWPGEWPRYFPNGWPDDWPCDFPNGWPHDGPHDFPHGYPHDWPHDFPHGWPHDFPHGYPDDWPCEWPDNWHEYWPDHWPNYWDGDCYSTGSVPAVPPPAENCEVFPKEFSFGVASGAYHIEGAWDQDCKSESIWDRWLHSCPSIVIDGSNGDFAADAYNHIKGDIEILNNLTVRHYVFSISWSRIIYDGCGDVNPYGIAHYRHLINLLKLNHIEPIVVLYYGDLPQALEDQGGFLCPSFVDWYTEYARVCFENFGDEVKYWITFHKPAVICKDGYGVGTFAPGVNDGPGNNEYICGHNLLKAHAAVYHMYDECFRSCQNGKISITLNSDWYEPQSNCDTDVCAAETKLQFQVGWFAHPIYLGDYPEVMIERIRLRCDYNGYYNSRLPCFTPAEVEYIKGTHDFFSLAYESAYYVSCAADNYWSNVCYDSDVGVELYSCDGDIVYSGIRQLLAWISRNYYNPSVFITNDGYGTCSRDCYDCDRIEYIKAILRNVRLSMIEDYTRVYGYTYYSYIDGFEWNLIDGRLAGYSLKYGLYDVEFDCPQKTRTARSSAAYFQHLASTGCIEDPCPSNHYYYYY